MPKNEKFEAWKADLERRVGEIKEKAGDDFVPNNEITHPAANEKAVSKSPEEVCREYKANGWELFFDGHKTMSPKKLPELQRGEKLKIVYAQDRKLIFVLKKPSAGKGVGHSKYDYE
jgi:hypothetical protein